MGLLSPRAHLIGSIIRRLVDGIVWTAGAAACTTVMYMVILGWHKTNPMGKEPYDFVTDNPLPPPVPQPQPDPVPGSWLQPALHVMLPTGR